MADIKRPVILSLWSQDSITFPAVMSDDTYGVLPTREAHLSLGDRSYHGGTAMQAQLIAHRADYVLESLAPPQISEHCMIQSPHYK